jgi:hypothetical protein
MGISKYCTNPQILAVNANTPFFIVASKITGFYFMNNFVDVFYKDGRDASEGGANWKRIDLECEENLDNLKKILQPFGIIYDTELRGEFIV